MNAQRRSRIVRVGSFVLAFLLLWLALHQVDFAALVTVFAGARYAWLLPVIVALLASHAVRAWRWQLFLEGLPHTTGMRKATFGEAFGSVMVGYMVNYVAPRVGEVTRPALLSKRTGLPFSSVLGTVVLERVVDVVVLALGLLFLPLALGPQLRPFLELVAFPDPIFLWPAFVAVAVTAGLVWLFRPLLVRTLRPFWARTPLQRLLPVAQQFLTGLSTIRSSPYWGRILLSTLTIWGLYVVAAWIPFRFLGLSWHPTWTEAYAIMLLGALGFLVPTPGGVGAYHYVIVLVLTRLYALGADEAAAYAVFSHGAQMVLYTLVGALSLFALGFSFRSVPSNSKTEPLEPKV